MAILTAQSGPGRADGCDLTVAERLLLFRLAPDTQAASITHAQHMMVRGLIERDCGATQYRLTDRGRTALAALLVTGET